MKPTLIVYSDYICPWCYLAQAVVDRLLAEYDLEVEWRPYLLRPRTPAEGRQLTPEARERLAQYLRQIEEPAALLGLPFRVPDLIPSTRLAHEATEYARDQGRQNAFHRAVFRRYYGHGKNIGDWAVLRAAAEEAGLDPNAMQEAVTAGHYRARVEALLQSAEEEGVELIPAFRIGSDGQGVDGFVPYEHLARLVEKARTSG